MGPTAYCTQPLTLGRLSSLRVERRRALYCASVDSTKRQVASDAHNIGEGQTRDS